MSKNQLGLESTKDSVVEDYFSWSNWAVAKDTDDYSVQAVRGWEISSTCG